MKQGIQGAAHYALSNPILWIIGIVLLGIIYIVTKSNGLPDPEEFEEYDSGGSSLTKAEARHKAELLYAAMKGMGTNEELVFQVLKDLSFADYGKVYNEFGKRYYNALVGEGGWNVFTGEEDLNVWLISELTKGELEDLKVLNPALPF